jgi:GTP-binding protein Era
VTPPDPGPPTAESELSSGGPTGFRSGFATLVGRPNVGKSTLMNRIVGAKVSIVSDRPQTTRNEIRGVHTTDQSQIVFLDTPGIHRPRTLLGERTNSRALGTLGEVDVVCFLVEANAPIAAGDRYIAELVTAVSTPKILVINKVDLASGDQVLEHLIVAAADLGDFDAYVPLSGRTGEGIDALLGEIGSRLPEGPVYYPDGMISDQPETFLAAELVREKLLAVTHDELPHSITVSVEELEPVEGENPPDDLIRLRATIRVERDSQKGIVIGKGGSVLKTAATAARIELEQLLGLRVWLETRVKVDADWQRRPGSLDRLGY